MAMGEGVLLGREPAIKRGSSARPTGPNKFWEPLRQFFVAMMRNRQEKLHAAQAPSSSGAPRSKASSSSQAPDNAAQPSSAQQPCSSSQAPPQLNNNQGGQDSGMTLASRIDVLKTISTSPCPFCENPVSLRFFSDHVQQFVEERLRKSNPSEPVSLIYEIAHIMLVPDARVLRHVKKLDGGKELITTAGAVLLAAAYPDSPVKTLLPAIQPTTSKFLANVIEKASALIDGLLAAPDSEASALAKADAGTLAKAALQFLTDTDRLPEDVKAFYLAQAAQPPVSGPPST
ncbi:Uncharacterised protein [Candidatus Burarchaeum australiense]|nr:Uncharacterised protein [Candidatus Burarchaeum australiense]